MASPSRHKLPIISGRDQTIASAFLGDSRLDVGPESSTAGSRTYIASGDARQINGLVSTTFTGPVEKVDAYFTAPSDHDKFEKLLNWLAPCNHSASHKSALRSRAPGTGLWFLESHAFKDWLTLPASLIWLHGGVGCGKTILCSSAVDKVRSIHERRGPGNGSASCYFYCSFQDDSRKDLSAILRVFIASICTQYCATSQLEALYAECHTTYPAETPSTDQLQSTFFAILQDHQPNSWMMSAATAKVTALNETHRGVNDTFLFIDALDEIPRSEREDVLQFLQELGSLRLAHLHVLVSSRNEPTIEEALSQPVQWNAIMVPRSSVNVDIDSYVCNTIESDLRLRRQSKATKEYIITRLVDGAYGMFRWAALQIAALKRLSVINQMTIEAVMDRLPADLNESYARILSQVDDCLVYQASIALKWLVLSARSLFVEELVEACAIHPERIPVLDEERYRLNPHNIVEMLVDIITIEPSISESSEIVKGVHKVALAHFSVQEFLTSKNIAQPHNGAFEVSHRASQLVVARSCLAYLYHYNTWPNRHQFHPLREYAWYFWERHICPNQETSEDRLRRKAIRLYNCLNSHMEIHDLVSATNWLPRDGIIRLKESLNVPFFYEDFDAFGGYKERATSSYSGNLARYCPLGKGRHIRLLTLLPCLDEETELRCRRRTFDLDEQPVYDALSYTWGSSQEQVQVFVDGSKENVTANLGSTLRRLRYQGALRSQHLWVDALCLNMADLGERIEGVGLMASIYRQAREVVISQGEGNVRDEAGINYVTELASALTKSPNGDNRGVDAIVAPILAQIEIEDGWSSIVGLFEREWWRRGWIIQEIVLAANATLLYGMLSFNFTILDRVIRAAKIISRILNANGQPCHGHQMLEAQLGWQTALSISITRDNLYTGRRLNLIQLLWRFRFSIVRDPRDRIFCLLPLLWPQDTVDLQVDYCQSMPEVFSAAAVHMLRARKTLDLLSFRASSTEFGHDRIPSWVPHILASSFLVPLAPGMLDGHNDSNVFCAGGLGFPDFQVDSNGGKLTLSGICFDTIAETLPICIDMIDEVFKYLLTLKPPRKLPVGQSIGVDAMELTQPFLTVFWKTVLADQWHEGVRLKPEDYQHFCLPPQTDKEHQDLLQNPALNSHLRFIAGRQLILTRRGRLALAPAAAKVADSITVVPGGAVPYVFRGIDDVIATADSSLSRSFISTPSRFSSRFTPKDTLARLDSISESSRFQFIGECYMHGIMDGEAMMDYQVHQQTFTLV